MKRHGKLNVVVAVALLGFAAALSVSAQQEEGPPARNDLRVYSLKEFGAIGTAAEATESYKRALEAITEAGGGVLVIPPEVPQNWRYDNSTQWSHSINPSAARFQDWKYGAGVIVVDYRSPQQDVPNISVPQATGLTLNRTMRMARGDSLPHWSTNPVLNIQNNLVHGSCSYLEWLQEPVKAGKDRRFYVPTIRGIFPGQFLNAHGGKWYGEPVARLTVKALGYDEKKKMHYFVADTPYDHPVGAIIHNKSNTGGLRVVTNANATNQTFDLRVVRNHYANGDAYLVATLFNYMGNIHSAAGDENGVCFAAFTHSKWNIFRATVKSMNWDEEKLTYTGARNEETLSNSRPLINLNRKKWITQGKVIIVPPESYYDPTNSGKWVFEGKSYPTTFVKAEVSGSTEIRMGGLIRGTKDCPWTEDIIGRWFAVDEKSEYVRGTVRRWYEITGLKVNPDGTKDIKIKRFWWGAKEAGSPTLYDPENYTRDVNYVIAPGAYVNNVSEAVNPNRASGLPGRSAVYLAPYKDQGTEFDFEPGDPVEQAIGPDPFRPVPFRAWLWDEVPGAMPGRVFEVANHASISRDTVLHVSGGPKTLEDCKKRRDRRPPWGSIVEITSASRIGLDCKADFSEAAILFRQPNHPQAIKWNYDGGAKTASLSVSPESGDMEFEGGNFGISGGSLLKTGGISATATEARNLRGIDVPVNEGARSITITFDSAEADNHYALWVEPNWLTAHAVVAKTPEGFTVRFAQPAPAGARLDWIMVR